ncbi:hypothetical protein CABS01_05420 [Colletotrichum abscissum]|nr:uncharacterized protein CABS01_05420 [Colletotrichum abscissum]KAK1520915.1 hypothetical protein CABS01_05420 [Colletotrichum abscissum]
MQTLVVNATRRLKNAKRAEITSDNTRFLPQIDPDNLLDVEGFPATLGDFWSMDERDIRQLATNLGMESDKVAYPKLMHQAFERIAGLLTEVMT